MPAGNVEVVVVVGGGVDGGGGEVVVVMVVVVVVVVVVLAVVIEGSWELPTRVVVVHAAVRSARLASAPWQEIFLRFIQRKGPGATRSPGVPRGASIPGQVGRAKKVAQLYAWTGRFASSSLSCS
jgi:hypothetical protein